MTDEKLSKDELQAVINEMTARVGKVADLVDQVSPDKAVGVGIRDLVDKLRGHVQSFTEIHDEMDDFVLDDSRPAKVISPSELKLLAIKNCEETFKQLDAMVRIPNVINSPDTLRAIEVFGRHGRELYASLQQCPW